MTETATVETPATVETRTFEGTIESAYGKDLADFGSGPLSFSGEYEHILSFDAIPAKETPDNSDILTMVNNKRKANARQKEMQKVLDGAGIKKPTMEDDEELRIKAIVTGLVASKKYNTEQATTLARQMLGVSA